MGDYYARGRIPPPPQMGALEAEIVATPARVLAAGMKDGFLERNPGLLPLFPFTFASLHWASAVIVLDYGGSQEGLHIAEPDLYHDLLTDMRVRTKTESIDLITSSVARERARGPGLPYDTSRGMAGNAIEAVDAMFAGLAGKAVYGMRRGGATIGIRTTKAL